MDIHQAREAVEVGDGAGCRLVSRPPVRQGPRGGRWPHYVGDDGEARGPVRPGLLLRLREEDEGPLWNDLGLGPDRAVPGQGAVAAPEVSPPSSLAPGGDRVRRVTIRSRGVPATGPGGHHRVSRSHERKMAVPAGRCGASARACAAYSRGGCGRPVRRGHQTCRARRRCSLRRSPAIVHGIVGVGDRARVSSSVCSEHSSPRGLGCSLERRARSSQPSRCGPQDRRYR